jgi:ATP-dependent Clp protease ATP-binding subunit ClpA
VAASEYERFSDAAHRAVVSAEREAREAGHEIVGTEHLLVSLASVDDDVRSRLAASGLTAEALRERVLEWAPSSGGPVEHAVFSPSLRRAVQLSGRLATQERSSTITGRHLLRAVLEVEDDLVLRVLIGLGVDPGALRRRAAPVIATAERAGIRADRADRADREPLIRRRTLRDLVVSLLSTR